MSDPKDSMEDIDKHIKSLEEMIRSKKFEKLIADSADYDCDAGARPTLEEFMESVDKDETD